MKGILAVFGGGGVLFSGQKEMHYFHFTYKPFPSNTVGPLSMAPF